MRDVPRIEPSVNSFRAGPILLEKFCVSPKDSLRDRTILFVLAYRRVKAKRIVRVRMAKLLATNELLRLCPESVRAFVVSLENRTGHSHQW
jgi:hypothetical protein